MSWPQRSTCTENWLVYCFSAVIFVIVLLVHEYKHVTYILYIGALKKIEYREKVIFFCNKILKVKLESFRVLNARMNKLFPKA